MLSNTLNTNEIKTSAGAGIAFQRLATNNRDTEFALVGESPALPHRLTIKHSESGSGFNKRRRSVVRFDKTVASTVDPTVPVTCSAYVVLDAPVGALTTMAEPGQTIANLNSFMASLGASTTILFDGTGNGSAALLAGSL